MKVNEKESRVGPSLKVGEKVRKKFSRVQINVFPKEKIKELLSKPELTPTTRLGSVSLEVYG